MERDRLAEQRKFEDMKDNNRIKQIQVEGENRIKEAKLKGDIEANIKCLNNEAQAQSQKYNQEVLKIQNNTLRINKTRHKNTALYIPKGNTVSVSNLFAS